MKEGITLLLWGGVAIRALFLHEFESNWLLPAELIIMILFVFSWPMRITASFEFSPQSVHALWTFQLPVLFWQFGI